MNINIYDVLRAANKMEFLDFSPGLVEVTA